MPLTLVCRTLIAMFVVTFALSLFVPIFEDEIGWLMLRTRYFLDDGVTISLWQTCPPRLALVPAWYRLPLRLLDGWTTGALIDPLAIRLTGLLSYATWLGFAVALLPKAVARGRLAVAGIGAGYLAIGLIPFALAINRPEQQLLLVIVPLAAVALWPWDRAHQTSRRDLVVALCLIVATYVLVGHHTKGVLFGPLAAVAAWFAIRRPTIRLATLGAEAGLGLLFGLAYARRLVCPGYPGAMRYINDVSLPFQKIAADPGLLAYHLFRRIRETPVYFERVMLHQGEVHLKWLPPRQALDFIDPIANFGFVAVLVGAAVIAVVGFGRLLVQAGRTRTIGPRLGVTACLLLGIVATLSLQGQKHFYDGGFLWVVVGLTALIAWRPLRTAWARPLRRIAVAGLAGAAFVSQVALWTWFVPEVETRLADDTYRPSRGSFSAFDYDRARTEIRDTARMCRIPLDGTSRYLALDVATYGVAWPTWRPIFVNYLIGYWQPVVGDPIEYLSGRGSAGLLAACNSLPDDLAARTRRNGAYCCLPSFAGQ